MMQLVSQSPSITPPPAPAGIGWIDLKEAARRAGYSSDGVLRHKLKAWIPAGMAKQEKSGNAKARWMVREDADPKFARVKFPEQINAAAELRPLTDKQRAAVQERRRLIGKWESERAAGVTLGLPEVKITANFLNRLLIDEGITLSRRTLYNWLAGYRLSGTAGLIDERWRSQQAAGSNPDSPDPFLDEIKRLYLTQRRLKLTVCHEMASLKASEQGWPVRSYKTAQRFIDAIPLAVLLKHRFGDEAHNNDAQPFLEKDYSTLNSNQIWCGDHHQFDAFVQISDRTSSDSGEVTFRNVRPWLSAWMDERSRKIVGWTIIVTDPNSDTILAALQHGISSHGVPEHVRMDNGKDYDCYAFHGETKKQRRRRIRLGVDERSMGIFVQLGIGTKHVQPYHGQSKPIERFFRTLEDRFGRTWDTYCGNSPENCPEDLPDKLKAGKAPTLEDFTAAFETWLEHDYHARGHGGDAMDGKSPSQVWTEQLQTKRTAAPELIELLLMKPTKPIKVQQNGVTWQGIRYGQFEPALQVMLGKQVVLRIDRRDLSRVSVFTVEGRFVCVAPANKKISANADAETLREALRETKRARSVMKQYHQVRPRLSEDVTDRMTRAAAMKHRKAGTDRIDPTLPPPSFSPVRSPLEGELESLQKAFKPRMAVGAESMSDSGESLQLGNYQSNNSAALDNEGSALGDVTDYLKYRSEDDHE